MSANPISQESFADLFEASLTRQEMRQGEVITAEVVRIDQNFVVVNAGLKSESYIEREEFLSDAGELEVKVGDFTQVAIEQLENGFGETRLSRERAKRVAAWNYLETALNEGTLVTGTITGKVKGGLTVMANSVRAFLPGSLVDMRPVKDTTPYEGKTYEFKVIKLDRKRNNVVVSRRAVLEASVGEEREALLSNLKEGSIVKGVVKNITDYGAFVDLAEAAIADEAVIGIAAGSQHDGAVGLNVALARRARPRDGRGARLRRCHPCTRGAPARQSPRDGGTPRHP